MGNAICKVSFIIPAFNNAAWLPHAVKSCLEQTHKDIEVVIVDDASTDSTPVYLAWLAKQNDKRIRIIHNSKNMGRSESRNIGNYAATGDILLVLDADDLAIETRAEWTLKKMKTCSVCYGGAVVMDALGNVLNEIPAKPINKDDCIKTKQNGIVHSTMAYTKEIAVKYPYKAGKISDLGIDDWEQQIRMIDDGVKFDFIPDVICAYRVHGAAVTQTRNADEVAKLKEEILEGLKCKI